MLTASAPAAHRPLTSCCKSMSRMRPRSPLAPVASAASSTSTTMPGPSTARLPTASCRCRLRSRSWSPAATSSSCWASSSRTSCWTSASWTSSSLADRSSSRTRSISRSRSAEMASASSRTSISASETSSPIASAPVSSNGENRRLRRVSVTASRTDTASWGSASSRCSRAARWSAASWYPGSRGCAKMSLSSDMDASGRRSGARTSSAARGMWPILPRVGAAIVRDPDVLGRGGGAGADDAPELLNVEHTCPPIQADAPDRERPAEDLGESADGSGTVAQQQERESIEQIECRRLAEEVHRQGHQPVPAQNRPHQQEQHIASHKQYTEPQRNDVAQDEGDHGREDVQPVRDGIEQLAQPGDLVPSACEHAVQVVGEPGHGE